MIGLNILGDRGVPISEIVAETALLGAHYHLVMDNPILALEVQSTCRKKLIYRMWQGDDNAQDSAGPLAAKAQIEASARHFVQIRHAEAPPGALIYLGNEPWATVRLAVWTLAAMKECERLGRRGVILNFSTGNPSIADLQRFKDVLLWAYDHGHVLGLHEYFDVDWHKDYPFHVGRFLEIRKLMGGRMPETVITELGCCVNFLPLRGYRWANSLSDARYGAVLAELGALYARYNVHALIFARTSEASNDDWRDFNPRHAVLERAAVYNQSEPDMAFPTFVPRSDPSWQRRTAYRINGGGGWVRSLPTTVGNTLLTVRITNGKSIYVTESNPYGVWRQVIVDNVVGWTSANYLRLEIPAEPPIKKLSITYVSQLGNTPQNDCGPAACLMLYQDKLKRIGLNHAPGITLSTFLAQTPGGGYTVLSTGQLVSLLTQFGIQAGLIEANPEAIRACIDVTGKPVLVLVAYKNFFPNHGDFGHFAVITGYSENGFYAHDSYLAGADYFISSTQLDQALKAYRYQGLVIP